MAFSDAQKIAGSIVAVVLALTGVVSALSIQRATPVVAREEGGRHRDGSATAYADHLAHGLPTACEGITGRDHHGNVIIVGHVYTRQECDEMLQVRLRATASTTFHCIPAQTVATGAATISLAFNIGTTNFCRSTVAREFRAGHVVSACNHFLDWRWAGHPRRPALLGRRQRERTLCLAGA